MFSKLLWEIDPHYSKLQARGKSFPKIVEDKFLNFNRPQDHAHKAKNNVKKKRKSITQEDLHATKQINLFRVF